MLNSRSRHLIKDLNLRLQPTHQVQLLQIMIFIPRALFKGILNMPHPQTLQIEGGSVSEEDAIHKGYWIKTFVWFVRSLATIVQLKSFA